MAFREIVAPTVKELFIQQLEGMILSGELLDIVKEYIPDFE